MKNNDIKQKSSREEIRKNFDQDVERFSNLDTGQRAVIDAPLMLELITSAAVNLTTGASAMLDIGCGAGNYTLKMLQKIPDLDCTLIDLSMPMLERAKERISAETKGQINIIQADILEVELPDNCYDIIVAGAVLHHLRKDEDWEVVFGKVYQSLKPGGSFWISDLVSHETDEMTEFFEEQYAIFLEKTGGAAYRETVMAHIEEEDTPRPVTYQLQLLKNAGFRFVELLHKNARFAAFGGIK